MFKTLANAWKVADLKKKIIFTLLILLVYRVGACITVPFISFSQLSGTAALEEAIREGNYLAILTGTLSSKDVGIFSIMSGNAFSQATLFALGVSPYITSSIVMQLLAVAIPALERLSRSENGKNKINSITRFVTIAIALITSIGYYVYLDSQGAIRYSGNFFYAVVIIACYCAGSSLVMWLAEKINEHGIGNGISLILFANIVSRFPTVVMDIINLVKNFKVGGIIYSIFACLFMLFLLWFIIFITDSERRIPVQYAKKVVGRKMYGGQNTNLPIKLNMAGVMPIIFASSIMNIPSIINMFVNAQEGWFHDFVAYCTGIKIPIILVNFVLIVAFAYFYVAISFNPVEVAGNLQKNGGSIPGIRPGRPTSDFIKNVLSRITLIGALALSVIAVVPTLIQFFINLAVGHNNLMIQDFVYAGSSVIIAVGVVLETIKEIETQMSMRHYKGFLE